MENAFRLKKQPIWKSFVSCNDKIMNPICFSPHTQYGYTERSSRSHKKAIVKLEEYHYKAAHTRMQGKKE